MRVELGSRAIADLEAIDQYTTEIWGENQAVIYVSLLYEIMQRLADYPMLGKSVPHLGNSTRTLTAQEHVIVYRLTGAGSVRVLRLLHKSRMIVLDQLGD